MIVSPVMFFKISQILEIIQFFWIKFKTELISFIF